MTCFRTCSNCHSRSQAGYAITITTRCPTVFSPPSDAPPLLLGGDRPSQTTHQALSVTPIQGPTLEHQNYKGGISGRLYI